MWVWRRTEPTNLFSKIDFCASFCLHNMPVCLKYTNLHEKNVQADIYREKANCLVNFMELLHHVEKLYLTHYHMSEFSSFLRPSVIYFVSWSSKFVRPRVTNCKSCNLVDRKLFESFKIVQFIWNHNEVKILSNFFFSFIPAPPSSHPFLTNIICATHFANRFK